MASMPADQKKQMLILGGLVAAAAVVVLFVYPGILTKGNTPQKKAPTPAANAAKDNKATPTAAADNKGYSAEEMDKDTLPQPVVLSVKRLEGVDPYIAKDWRTHGPKGPGDKSAIFEIESFFGDYVKLKGEKDFLGVNDKPEKDNKKYVIIEVNSADEYIVVKDTNTGENFRIEKKKIQ